MDGRVKRSTGRGIGLGGGAAGSGREATGAFPVGEGVVNREEGPRMFALINPDETEALFDNELSQWDMVMSEELDPPQ
jgi:hypothetical protein